MTTTSPSYDPKTAIGAELATFGPVHLDVTDAGRSVAFWSDRVGLRVRGQQPDAIELGTDADTLLVLHPGAIRPARRGHAGLYHVAIHLPNEAEFARVLARLFQRRTMMSPTDHVFSKAIYFDDPDGLGLELTLETPERLRSVRMTPMGPEVVDADGNRRSGRDPLDVREVLSHLPDDDLDRPMTNGTFVGHVHLHVGDIDAGRRFYTDGLGFTLANDFGSGVDFHGGGRFKHRMAINTWQGTGVTQPPAGTAGLRHFEIRFTEEGHLQDVLDRLPNEVHGNGHLVHDPAGNAIVLTA